jgi:hypothetical protein
MSKSAVRSIPGLPLPPGKTPVSSEQQGEEKEEKREEETSPTNVPCTFRKMWGRAFSSKDGPMDRYGCYDADDNLIRTVLRKRGSGRTSKLGSKFSRCVKSVRKTVKARPKSSKESAAIAICTKSVLQTRGRTIKKYRKGRLITQKKRKM